MEATLTVGIILVTGFIFGEIATKIKLPKVTGYILAGILLNPRIFNIVPASFPSHTNAVTNICLSFITFSIGGTLLYSRIKKLGKSIVTITVCEAEFAFLAVILGFLATLPFFIRGPNATWFATYIPISLLIGSLASPTDPSATLAVAHQYKAEGEVSSTVMGVAASDDALGIINYSLAVVLAKVFITHQKFNAGTSLLGPLIVIAGAILLGMAFGFIFNLITEFIKKETEGVFIVVIIGLLSVAFGVAKLLGVDELLTTMTMGIVVVNFNAKRDKIFQMLERYTEELIFVLFFTLSGMHLNFSVLSKSLALVFLFAIFRIFGKVTGTMVGASISKASAAVRKYTAGGLIASGGIVVGLALMLKQTPAYNAISDIIINVIIGATVIHELIGAICVKMVFKKAGEIKG